ncbi:hypothetical protein DFH94DRAFT_138934 [Russula ochroleuca]|jgi:hypothetical protein|uniref:Uncharacterized protein n=1 Tax=Russula ochroleuca TaxID=152965 RepID=A0A9P5JZJ4_9AGAM|nr:hypothetical protein DFH94DRAFT_138934 [Russula ochroleuca]
MGDPALEEGDETGCLEMQVYTMLKAHSPHGRAHTPPFPPRHQRVSLERRLITYRLSKRSSPFISDKVQLVRTASQHHPIIFRRRQLMSLPHVFDTNPYRPYKFAMSTIGEHSQHRGGEHFEPQELLCPLERLPDSALRAQADFGCIRRTLTGSWGDCRVL